MKYLKKITHSVFFGEFYHVKLVVWLFIIFLNLVVFFFVYIPSGDDGHGGAKSKINTFLAHYLFPEALYSIHEALLRKEE